MKLSFCSLSSGSSGNCYYLGNESCGILIDAGISAGAIRKYLKYHDISIESIMGVFITHNHIDHIRGLEVLTRKHHIPVFTTPDVWKSILNPRRNITNDCIHKIHEQVSFHLDGFDIVAFPVSHDAPSTLGFHISSGNLHSTIVTDLGHICQTSAEYIKYADLLIIESNYDEDMLANGRYPHFLKSRIKSDHGHLGNHQTSDFLADIFDKKLRYICLAHLSINNNTTEKALQTLQKTFKEKGIKPDDNQKILVLPRNQPGEMISIEN